VLNSAIPGFSTIFEQNDRGFLGKNNVIYLKKGTLKIQFGIDSFEE